MMTTMQVAPEDLDFDFAHRCFDFTVPMVDSIVMTAIDLANGRPKTSSPFEIYAEQLLEVAQFRAAVLTALTDEDLTVDTCYALRLEASRIAPKSPRYAEVIGEAIARVNATIRQLTGELIFDAPIPESALQEPVDADLVDLALARATTARSRRI